MINSTRLYDLRKGKGLSRTRLSQLSKVSVRTIQRLENPTQENRTPHWNTLDSLAKALQVEPEELADGASHPGPGNSRLPEPRRVQIGVEIAPKARLAYDLVKRRYGVSPTEIINMAPLFFALLAEGSLAQRLEKLSEAREAIDRLDRIGGEIGHPIFTNATTVAQNAEMVEHESIGEGDIFGEHLLGGSQESFFGEPFDPSTENPFASHLRRLADHLERPGVVRVERGDLSYGAPWSRFPDYNLCDDQLDYTTNGSSDARRALETGYVRLSEIPEELEAEGVGKERAAWLGEKLPNIYRELEAGHPMAEIAKFEATATPTEMEQLLAKLVESSASRNNDGTAEEGEVQ